MEVLSAVTAASSWGALGPRRERNEDDILRPEEIKDDAVKKKEKEKWIKKEKKKRNEKKKLKWGEKNEEKKEKKQEQEKSLKKQYVMKSETTETKQTY